MPRLYRYSTENSEEPKFCILRSAFPSSESALPAPRTNSLYRDPPSGNSAPDEKKIFICGGDAPGYQPQGCYPDLHNYLLVFSQRMVLICPWCEARIRPGLLEKHKLLWCPKAPLKDRRLMRGVRKKVRADRSRRGRIAAGRALTAKGKIPDQWAGLTPGLKGKALKGGLPSLGKHAR